jgi:hypothetical protein
MANEVQRDNASIGQGFKLGFFSTTSAFRQRIGATERTIII